MKRVICFACSSMGGSYCFFDAAHAGTAAMGRAMQGSRSHPVAKSTPPTPAISPKLGADDKWHMTGIFAPLAPDRKTAMMIHIRSGMSP